MLSFHVKSVKKFQKSSQDIEKTIPLNMFNRLPKYKRSNFIALNTAKRNYEWGQRPAFFLGNACNVLPGIASVVCLLFGIG